MRRKRLMATALVSLVIGAVLALVAPAASAAESGSAPSNRGWVAGSHSDGGD